MLAVIVLPSMPYAQWRISVGKPASAPASTFKFNYIHFNDIHNANDIQSHFCGSQVAATMVGSKPQAEIISNRKPQNHANRS